MKRPNWLGNQRGSILLFTTVAVVPLMIIFGGMAMDLAYLGTVDNEVQRSLDAAALAGAGQLRFDSSVFPAARQWAQDYALKNTYRAGTAASPTINLNLNTANAANDHIVLGIWNGSAFTPSLDGTQVNAVLCRYQTTIPTSFLRVLGFTGLPVSGEAIAVAAQPATPPRFACVAPIALSSCVFGGPTSLGCGATATFISGASGNSAAWASIDPRPLSAENILSQFKAVGSPDCSSSISTLSTGNNVPVEGGELEGVIPWLKGRFSAMYVASPVLEVQKAGGSAAYRGQGWEVFVPVIDTGPGCPPGAITGPAPIVGWTRMVITQVFGKDGTCAVANHWAGNPWDEHCVTGSNGTAASLPPGWAGQTGIFGYYDCTYIAAPPSPVPGPITATARLRLVR